MINAETVTIDIETDEIVQPEHEFQTYPVDRVIKTTEQLLDCGGSLVGFVDEYLHYDPVIHVPGSDQAEMVTEIQRLLEAETLTGPGVTAYFVDDTNDVWAVLFIEDWYEECIPYQKLHFSRGDPVALTYVKAQAQTERERLREFGLFSVWDRHVDHDVAMWGQVQLLHVHPYLYAMTLSTMEEGNPDRDPALRGDVGR